MTRLAALLALLLISAFAAPWAVAQPVSRMPRVGVLVLGSPEHSQGLDDFRQGMRALGWTEGSNVSIEALSAAPFLRDYRDACSRP